MSSSASANSLDSGAAPNQPEAELTPGELLDIGASRQNHYAVQVAPNGASDFVIHSQAVVEAGYSEGPYFVVTPNGRAVDFYTRLDALTTPGSRYPRSDAGNTVDRLTQKQRQLTAYTAG